MASKSKRNKVKFKFTKELGFLLGAILVMIIVTIVLAIPSSSQKELENINTKITEYNTENSTSIYTLSKDTRLKEISYDGLLSEKENSGYTIVWYGSLSEEKYLTYLSTLDTMAENYDVEHVYLFYATYVEQAKEDEETDTFSYKETLRDMQRELNGKKNPDATEIDLEKYPHIFVYKNGYLLFNSQMVDDSTEYSYEMYFNKAFGLTKIAA